MMIRLMTWFIELQNRFNESRLFKILMIYVLNWVDDLTSWQTVILISSASLRWSFRDLWLSRHWLYSSFMTHSSHFSLTSRHDSSLNLLLWLRYEDVKLMTASSMLQVLLLDMFMIAKIELTRAHNLLIYENQSEYVHVDILTI